MKLSPEDLAVAKLLGHTPEQVLEAKRAELVRTAQTPYVVPQAPTSAFSPPTPGKPTRPRPTSPPIGFQASEGATAPALSPKAAALLAAAAKKRGLDSSALLEQLVTAACSPSTDYAGNSRRAGGR